jgi:hypothetical protein
LVLPPVSCSKQYSRGLHNIWKVDIKTFS